MVQNHHLDSTRWDDIRFRPGDIVIGTWAKSGTTWLQQIVGQLLCGGAEDVRVADISPWVELRWYPKGKMLADLEAQAHRRFMKTHLPADALPLAATTRYIYVARDGRDVVLSLYNHHRNLTWLAYRFINGTPGRVGPALERPGDDAVAYFRAWLARDGFPFWPYWPHVRSWWDIRSQPNVLLVHYENLKRDLQQQIRRIARFLSIDVPDERWPTIAEHCSFDFMKRTGAALPASIGLALNGGAATFLRKGTSGGWRDALPAEDVLEYERAALRNLGPECAAWLNSGSLPDE